MTLKSRKWLPSVRDRVVHPRIAWYARFSSPQAASDNVTHGTWILVAVALGVLSVGAVAVPSSPVHHWLDCHLSSITEITSTGPVWNTCVAPGSSADALAVLAPAGTTESFTFNTALTTTNGDGFAGYAVDHADPNLTFLEAPSGTTFGEGTFYGVGGRWYAYSSGDSLLGQGSASSTVTFPAGTTYVAEYVTLSTAYQSITEAGGIASITAGSDTFTFSQSTNFNGALNATSGDAAPAGSLTPNGLNTIQLQA